MMEHINKYKFVYIALVIVITLSSLGYAIFFYYRNLDRIEEAKVNNQATDLAKQKIEELKKEKWSKIKSGEDEPEAGYDRTWSVKTASVEDKKESNMKEVKVVVKWDKGKESVSLATYIYRWAKRKKK